MEQTSSRKISVDAFRGLTIIGMILVNNPGDWDTVYPPLLHSNWHGWTPTDIVFPFFLFIVGVAIVLAIQHRVESGVERRKLIVKLIKRSVVLFALGLFLNGFPFGIFGPQSLPTFFLPGEFRACCNASRCAIWWFQFSFCFAVRTPCDSGLSPSSLAIGR